MEYKIGQKVRVKENLEEIFTEARFAWGPGFKEYKNKIMKIKSCGKRGFILHSASLNGFYVPFNAIKPLNFLQKLLLKIKGDKNVYMD
jgi:hypothetical protein